MRNTHVQKFLRDESGQAMTEYILLIGLISIPIWIAFRLLLIRFLNVFISSVVSSFSRG